MKAIMDQVHKIQLELALDVKRICLSNNIKYFLVAGSLLGAIRHNGFIPWDDDLDIGMLREDYDKFVKIAQKEMKNEYFLQTWDTDPGFALPVAKIRKNGTKFIEQNSAKANLHNGIYIDIFPFDNVPNSQYNKKIQNIKTYILKRIILIKLGYEVWEQKEYIKKSVYRLIKTITKPISVNLYKKMLNKEITKYNNIDSNNVVAIGGAHGYKNETIKKIWIEDLTTIKFENEELSCPKYYKEYLSYFYGDYMTPPPVDKRYNRHKILEIELGDNKL